METFRLMKHGHRPSRVAAFVAESVNVLQLQTATDALARHNRRAVLVSGQQSLLRGKNGTAEINFAVAETVTDLDESGYDALVLLEDAATQPEHATALSKRFADKGKPVIALRGSAGIVAAIAGAGSHTAGGKDHAVLKGAVRDFLKEKSFDFWSDFDNGVFLVRMNKGDRNDMV